MDDEQNKEDVRRCVRSKLEAKMDPADLDAATEVFGSYIIPNTSYSLSPTPTP